MQDLKLRPVGLRIPKPSALILTSGRMVGDAGFEPATPWTQTKCATKLRQSPTIRTQGKMGWMMGFEPTTTGITIRGSTN